MPKSTLVDVHLYVLRETTKAIMVAEDPHDTANAMWLPKSQIEVEDMPDRAYKCVTMPEWLAVEKRLI